MIWAKGTRILFLCGALSLTAFGQNPANPPSAQNNQPKTGNHKSSSPQPYQMGDWLRAHQNLTAEQQEKLLENDPRFKRQTPQRQAELKAFLRRFNSRPPAQRELMLNRLQWLGKLTPQQRQDIRDADQKLQTLPQDRRLMVHKALRHLRQMDPQERQQEFESDRFKSTFSEQEQGILTKLASINPPENPIGIQPGPESPK